MYYLGARIREDLVLGHDINPPQIRYLLPSTVEFYQNTDNIVYTEIYDMVKSGVSSPSMNAETRELMEKILKEKIKP